MVDHFNESIFTPQLLGARARAMVVTDGVNRAIDYYLAMSQYIQEKGLPFRAIIAFSGERTHNEKSVSESSLNGFPFRQNTRNDPGGPLPNPHLRRQVPDGLRRAPAERHVRQTRHLGASRQSRLSPGSTGPLPTRDSVFVLDFMNNPDAIKAAFEDYYQTTILSEETDPDKLHDLRGTLDQYQIYSWEQIDEFAEAFLNDTDRSKLDPRLDTCVEEYKKLDEDGQVEFKSSAKAFTRLYAFLSQVLPYGNAKWEKLSIFLNFLVNKLPAPIEEDLSRGVLEAVDMDSYRMERKAAQSISLAEEDAEIDSVLPGTGGGTHEPEMGPALQHHQRVQQDLGREVLRP